MTPMESDLRRLRVPGPLGVCRPTAGVRAVIVCVCRRVSDSDIRRAASEGIASFDELQFDLGVGTGCGCCRDSAADAWASACQGAGATAGADRAPGRAVARA